MNFYAGIGSRQTPPDVLKKMTSWAYYLSEVGFILRSGGAPGADSAFEAGTGPEARIYLPWKGFNGKEGIVYGSSPRGQAIAAKFHPAWDKLSQGAKKLMTRNVAQVLGDDNEPVHSRFVLCWTPEGKGGGGTGQAIRIAEAHGIPVFDLALPDASGRLDEWLWSTP